MALLAVLLLLISGVTWFGRAGIADAVVRAGGHVTRADAERQLVVWLLPYLVIGLVLAVSAVFLARRQPWARWTGLAATCLLALLMLVSILSGAFTATVLLTLMLAVAAITSLLARPTSAWVPRLRG